MARARCDVDGCTRHRFRWQRICARCFAVLPRRISLALITAHRAGDRPTWRALRKESGRLLTNSIAADSHRLLARASRLGAVSPQQAFRNHQRLLGERD
ncbi:MAG: hypothetical protein AB7E60_14015 [Sphingobium sp.]